MTHLKGGDDGDVVEKENRSHLEALGQIAASRVCYASEDGDKVPTVDKSEPSGKEETQGTEDHKEESVRYSSTLCNEIEKNESHAAQQQRSVERIEPTTPLEIAQRDIINRLEQQVTRLVSEVQKLKNFISKRRQNYKRKRKEENAPRRPLSAYNIFIKERFKQLEDENKKALESSDSGAELKRVPPSSLVAATGNDWRNLAKTEKDRYEKMALADQKRYEEQMATYEPPDRDDTKKRAKTGYNMFFSAYVVQLRRSEAGVPPERGSIARLVGSAWKELTAEEKQYYEREAERRNELTEDVMIPEAGVNSVTDSSKALMSLRSEEHDPQSPQQDDRVDRRAGEHEQPLSKGTPSSQNLYPRHGLPLSQAHSWASSRASRPTDGHRAHHYISHHVYAYNHHHPAPSSQMYYPRTTAQHLPPSSPSHTSNPQQWTR